MSDRNSGNVGEKNEAGRMRSCDITCDMCMDLIPLVKDGIASEDSREAVERHMKICDVCRAFYDGEGVMPAEDVNAEKVFQKLRRQVRSFSVVLLMFGIFFGLSLTTGRDMFLNILLMPCIGALGYVISRWKALYQMPLLLVATHWLTNILGLFRGAEHLNLYSVLMWSVLYSVFAVVGVIVAGLLHFAFRKHDLK